MSLTVSRISLLWLRRDLRLHDHVAISHALGNGEPKSPSTNLFFVYCLEVPQKKKCGHLRWKFLMESLADLDSKLRGMGSRLFVVRGKAPDVIPDLVRAWGITELLVQDSPEPHSQHRDSLVSDLLFPLDCLFLKFPGRTLLPLHDIISNHKPSSATSKSPVPLTMTSFVTLIDKKLAKSIQTPVPAPTELPLPKPDAIDLLRASHQPDQFKRISGPNHDFGVPEINSDLSIPELDIHPIEMPATQAVGHPGGETYALVRLTEYMSNHHFVRNFEKPKTNPTSNPPQTTVLSPYLTYGCLSPRLFYHELMQVYHGSKHTHPPVSLMGQLYWRDFFLAHSATIPNFEQVKDNQICIDPNWRCGSTSSPDTHPEDHSDLLKWKLGQTGFPWIDAVMTQLRTEGWIHHLARHSVACFLTRGDLYISWERGAEVFEEYLLDHEWALNRGNWLWLSGTSTFFMSYFRVYSPVKFGQSWDPEGYYIKRYLPQLAKFPKAFIYEPWKAPLSVQKSANCLIGVDYPEPILDHLEISKVNMAKIKAAYAAAKHANNKPTKRAAEDQPVHKSAKRQK